MKWFQKISRELFAFFASLQLAVVVLLGLAVVLAVGTFYESSYDADAARHFVYGTWWFTLLLGLLGTNVLFAALSRYPWKRRHTGFLVVHLGIILILIGSFITLFKGYEGQVILAEDETRDRIILKEPQLFFYDTATARLEEVPANFQYRAPSKEKPAGAKVFGNVLVKIEDYLPNAVSELQVSEGNSEEKNPAIQVKLAGSNATMEDWLFSRDYTKQKLALGPASLAFLELPNEAALTEVLKDSSLRGPVLWADGKLIPVRSNLGVDIPLKDRSILIQNFLPHAGVALGKLVNLSDKPQNPVVKLLVKGKEGEEAHTVFSKFPELGTRQKEVFKDENRFQLLWIPEDLGKQKNELVFGLTDSNQRIFYAIKHQDQWGSTQQLITENPISTGWMDFAFSVTNFFEHAEAKKSYRRVAVPKEQMAKGPPSAIHMVMANESATQDLWLSRGESQDVTLGGQNFKVAYALKMVPMGFSLKLKDFNMGTYEGTKDPSKFESQVTLIDDTQGITSDHLIGMNHPLKHGKYKVFQASYQLNPNGKDWSVLAVAYDPGIFLKYLGSIVLVTGVILIFYFRQGVFKKKSVKVKANASAATTVKLDYESNPSSIVSKEIL